MDELVGTPAVSRSHKSWGCSVEQMGGNSPLPWDSCLFPRLETLEHPPLGVRRSLRDYRLMSSPSSLPPHSHKILSLRSSLLCGVSMAPRGSSKPKDQEELGPGTQGFFRKAEAAIIWR